MTDEGVPTSVVVGPYRYAIHVEHEAMERIRRSDGSGDGHIGSSNHHQLKITVDGSLATTMVADTLLHEIVHCCYRVSGVGVGKMTEEEAIEHLTPILLDTLRRNPAVARYLFGNEEA